MNAPPPPPLEGAFIRIPYNIFDGTREKTNLIAVAI